MATAIAIADSQLQFTRSRRSAIGSRIRRLRVASARSRELDCVLAIDVGTGGTKACLVSSEGRLLRSGFSAHPAPGQSRLGGPLSMEQEQELWWDATVQAVRSCILAHEVGPISSIRGIAVTGQMQDVVIVPKTGSSFRSKAILYSDTRAGAEIKEVADLLGGSSILTAITGTVQGASSLLAKLRWMDKYMKDAAGNCDRLLFGGHDYVTWKLCGSHVTDVTTVSTTGLANSAFQMSC